MITLGGAPVYTNQQVLAFCAAPSNGRGRITFTDPSTIGSYDYAAYPTLDQGLFLIEIKSVPSGTEPSGAGVARQQTLTPPIVVSNFSGSYASNFLANIATGLEAFAGQINSNGVSMVTGAADVNSFTITGVPPGTPSLDATLNGSITAAANGRFPLALIIKPAAGPVTSLNPVCYILDANTCLLLGLDAIAPGTGILELQNTGL